MTKIMMRESLVKEIEPTPKGLIKNPASDLVVTRSKDGEALSVFSDDIWDYSATSNTLRAINFRAKVQYLPTLSNIDSNKLTLAVKFLKVFTLNWVCEVNGCSMSKLNSDLVAISFLVSYCLINHLDFNNIFTDADAIDFLVTNSSSEKQIGLCLGKIQRFIDTASVLNKNNF